MEEPQVFFNRPGEPFDLTLLLNDISAARAYVCLASAWFTDVAVADAVIAAPAPTKIVLLNAADLQRASVEAYTRLDDYFTATPAGDPTIVRGLFVLGGDDWRRDGMLHHKFVAVDPGVVWVGSYNFTTFGRNNYESLVRIADAAVAARFIDETLDLVREATTPNRD